MWKVYAVKTLYPTKTVGKAKAIDSAYLDNYHLIEERIFTLKARSFDEAISKGEKEAIRYAKETSHFNPCGQKVVQKYIGSIDAFEPFEEIKANVEVFSTTYLLNKTVSNEQITDNMFGKEIKKEKRLRKKFLDCEFSGIVKHLNPLAQCTMRKILAKYPDWEEHASLRKEDDFEVVVSAPIRSNAGCLAVFTENGKDFWVRYGPPQMCHPPDDENEMLSVIEQLLQDKALFVRITKNEKWSGTTLIRPGTEPILEKGERAQIVSWSGRFDRVIPV
jgi:hypothetical protein